jgi:hypothetical protein
MITAERVALHEGRQEMSEVEYRLRDIARQLCVLETEPEMRGPLTLEGLHVLGQAIRSAQKVCDRLVAIRENHKEAA